MILAIACLWFIMGLISAVTLIIHDVKENVYRKEDPSYAIFFIIGPIGLAVIVGFTLWCGFQNGVVYLAEKIAKRVR